MSQRYSAEKKRKKRQREISCFSPNQGLEEDPVEHLAQVTDPGAYI